METRGGVNLQAVGVIGRDDDGRMIFAVSKTMCVQWGIG